MKRTFTITIFAILAGLSALAGAETFRAYFYNRPSTTSITAANDYLLVQQPYSTVKKVKISTITALAGGGGTWGSITGTLGNQTDLSTALADKAPVASPTFTGTVTTPITGSTQCLHVNAAGVLSGTGADCGSGGGTMTYPIAGIAVSTGSAWDTSKTAPAGTIVGTSDAQSMSNKTIIFPVLTAAEVNASASISTLTAAQASRTVLTNYAQTGDAVIGLPIPVQGLAFVAAVGKAGSNKWAFKSYSTSQIILDGTAMTARQSVKLATPAIGNYISCWTFRSTSHTAWSYQWLCRTGLGAGTWTIE